ncbi:MAG: hypothetical protein ACTSQE_11470 [Candidatus Heimdallarchaeaceae archaeon]
MKIIRVMIKPKMWFIILQIVCLFITVVGIFILAAIADSIAFWILSMIIVLFLLFFGGKNIHKKFKPYYVAAPLREDMVEEEIVPEPTKRKELQVKEDESK